MDARRHRLPLSAFATALVASLALAAPSAQAANCPGADQLPLLSTTASAKAATLCLLNEERAANGIAPLRSQPTLEAAATSYAQSMVDQRFFAHVNPSGQTIDERLASYITGTRSYTIGENLAWGQSVLGTPVATVNAWMRSPGHRENILNADFEEIGVGIVPGSPSGGPLDASATYATEFGFREVAGGSSPTHASAASVSIGVTPPKAKAQANAPAKPKQLSAKTKRRISQQCHRVARRTKASTKTRRARYDHCVKTRTLAARQTAR
jgi:uncharacterized protein YkwD